MTEDLEGLSDKDLRRELRKAHQKAESWRLRLRDLILEARRRSWTQQTIGDEMGISQSAVSQRLSQMRGKTTE